MRIHCKPWLLAAAIVAAQVGASTARGDLIGYWNFEDGSGKVAADGSGNGNDGALTDAAAFTSDGKFGDALDLGAFNNGAGMDLPTAADGAFDSIVTTQNATISMWFNRNGDAPTDQWTFLFNSAGNRQLGSHAPWSDGNIYFDVSGCCNADQRISTPLGDAATDGQWHHLAYRKWNDRPEGTPETTIWLDGAVIVNSGDNEIADITPIDAAAVGSAPGGGNSQNGRIDEFAIWDEALSDQRIIDLANELPVLPLPEPQGDFNGDGLVDSADFAIMAENFNQKFAFGESLTKGDFNGDTKVNMKDFLGFRQKFNGAAGATAASVPEPAGLALLSIASAALLGLRRRRR